MTNFLQALNSIEELKLKDAKILGKLAKKIVKELIGSNIDFKNEVKNLLFDNISTILGQFSPHSDTCSLKFIQKYQSSYKKCLILTICIDWLEKDR